MKRNMKLIKYEEEEEEKEEQEEEEGRDWTWVLYKGRLLLRKENNCLNVSDERQKTTRKSM